MTHTNAELLRSGYDAFASGDIPSVLGIFAEDIAWHVPGRSPLSGDYRGHEGVVGFFTKAMELSGGTLRVEADEIVADGDRIIVLTTVSAERNGRSWSSRRSTSGASRTEGRRVPGVPGRPGGRGRVLVIVGSSPGLAERAVVMWAISGAPEDAEATGAQLLGQLGLGGLGLASRAVRAPGLVEVGPEADAVRPDVPRRPVARLVLLEPQLGGQSALADVDGRAAVRSGAIAPAAEVPVELDDVDVVQGRRRGARGHAGTAASSSDVNTTGRSTEASPRTSTSPSGRSR